MTNAPRVLREPSLANSARVPEVTVKEDGNLLGAKDNVWAADKRLHLFPKPEAKFV